MSKTKAGIGETRNMCQNCSVVCCSLNVDLTTYDITRIAVIEKKPPASFVTYWEQAENAPYAFRAFGKWIRLMLRKRDGRCVFYNQKKDLSCSVEDSKPALCLAYPFFLDGGKPVIRGDARCPPQRLMLADPKKMSEKVLRDADWEHERYFEFISDWNNRTKGDETLEDFLDFAYNESILEKKPFGPQFRAIRRKIRQILNLEKR